jgi:medium-chain acyl-[acyl-carrier-protein] hydrolase
MTSLAARLAAEISPDAGDRSFALFGHSMGARLAARTAAELSARGRTPYHLFVSAGHARSESTRTHALPTHEFIAAVRKSSGRAKREWTPLHALPTEEFVAAVRERFGYLPERVTADPSVWCVYERSLRADLKAIELDNAPPRSLPCPVTAFAGLHDSVVPPLHAAEWHEWAAGRFNLVPLPLGHFDFRQQPGAYLDPIAAALADFAGQDRHSEAGRREIT